MKPLILTKSEKAWTLIPVSPLASRKATIATATIAMAVALFAPALPPVLADPITASSPEDIVGPGNYFQTTVSLSGNRLSGTNHVFTHVKLRGYTGAVVILLENSRNEVMAATKPLAYGVDGQMVPFKSSSRTERFDIPVDPGIAAQTKSISIIHMAAPHNRLSEDLGWMSDVAKAISDAAKAIGPIIGPIIQFVSSGGGPITPPSPGPDPLPTIEAMNARLSRLSPTQITTFHAAGRK